jgi:hypothetical protein
MGAIPGIIDLPARVLTQCGLVSGLLMVAIIYLAIELAKARALSETDRASYVKLLNEQTAAQRELAIANAKLEGMLFAIENKKSP